MIVSRFQVSSAKGERPSDHLVDSLAKESFAAPEETLRNGTNKRARDRHAGHPSERNMWEWGTGGLDDDHFLRESIRLLPRLVAENVLKPRVCVACLEMLHHVREMPSVDWHE
jgi:hypothetical protein